tara:strand:+ start:761 stop:3016 length:2256 start_codon:yes stop_codon:yes gene_type:complete
MYILKFILLTFSIVLFSFNLVFAEVFKDIKVNGNKRISINSIIVLGNIEINKDYNERKLNTLLKDLYKTDFFKNVDLKITNNILNISVVENPIIENLIITGIKNKKLLDYLENSIKLKNRKSFSEFKARQDLIVLKSTAKALGYYFAEVSSSMTANKERNSVNLTYNLDLGKKAKIKKIIFLGQKNFKDKKLREIITSEEHKFWKFVSKKVYLNPEQIDLDERLLENYYKNNGYYNIKIDNSFAELDSDGNFNLIFNISSGKKFYFNKFSINIPPDFDSSVFEPINEIFLKLKDKKYSLKKVNTILDEVDKIATSRLYDFIDASIDETIVDQNKINFKVTIKESEKFYVDKINILGNSSTLEEVIRHQLIVDEGDPFNEILFNKSINNIKSLRLFKSVKSKIIDNPDNSLKSIDIEVEEMATGEISLGAGVGSSGTTVGGGIKENNFLGKGIALDTNISVTEGGIKGRFVYSKPNFNYSNNTLFTSLIAETDDNLKDNGYKVSTVLFSLGTTFEQYENLFFSPEGSISVEDLSTTSTASAAMKKNDGEYLDAFFNYSINYDLRDRSYQTTDGYQVSFYQNIPVVSEVYELANTIQYSKYQTLNESSNIVGKFSFYGKVITSLSDKDVRVSKRLFVPASKLRGFKPGKIGPIENGDYIGGNYVTSLNFSSNLPSILPSFENIEFSVFFDAANIWGVDYNKSIKDTNSIRSATGLSIDFLTPVGPLNFAFSQPITKSSTDTTESFRFNLGTTF